MVLPVGMTDSMCVEMESVVEKALGMPDVIWVDVLAPGVRGNDKWMVSVATETGGEEVKRYGWEFPLGEDRGYAGPCGKLSEAKIGMIMRVARPLFKIGELRWFGLESPKISGSGWVMRIYLEGKIWAVPIPDELP